MNFGTTSVAHPSDGWFVSPPHSQIRRRKSVKHYPNDGELHIAQFLDLNPKIKLTSKSGKKNGHRRDLDLELVQSQSQSNLSNNSTYQNKRPHSTPHSDSLKSLEDSHLQNHRSGWIGNNYVESPASGSKSRLPNIQMINKYYGLVPKKFTVQSRQGFEDGYTRNPRAKSAFLVTNNKPRCLTKNYSLDDPSGSDTEYNEPTWGKNGHRKSKCDDAHHPRTPISRKDSNTNEMNKGFSINTTSSSEISLQTKKIPVDRQNKLLKHRGRSSSLPLTSTGSDNFNPTYRPCPRESQRVIKIDLSNMSWEETCHSCSPDAQDDLYSNPENTSPRSNDFQSGESLQSINSSVDNDCNGNKVALTCSTTHIEPTLDNANDNINCKQFIESQANKGEGLLYGVEVKVQWPEIANIDTTNGSDEKNVVQPFSPSSSSSVTCEEESRMGTCGNTVEGSDFTLISSKRGKLKKTISFDEQILRESGERDKCKTDSAKQEIGMTKLKRPLTASSGNINNAHRSPNGVTVQNPPIPPRKVVPWTQSKAMSLSERRAKLQKSVSIHSTDSNSVDFNEECSDTETMSNWTPPQMIMPGPNSSAYKETRKSLFFHPAPEVPTMVSSISPPIETLDIEVDMEKVATILHNMQNQNKSFIDLTPDGAEVRVSEHEAEESVLELQVKNIKKRSEIILQNYAKKYETQQNDSFQKSINPFSTILAKHLPENAMPCAQQKNTISNDETGTKCPSKNDQFDATFSKTDGSLSGNGLIKEYLAKTGTNTFCKNQPCNTKSPSGGSHSPITGTTPSDPISTKVSHTAFRPQLKKAVSISCEKELLDTSASHRNEVNGGANGIWNNGIKGGPRPTTAATSKTLIRTSSTPSINIKSSSRHHSPSRTFSGNTNSQGRNRGQNSIQTHKKDNKSMDQSQCQSQNQNPASNNRKLLLKKALMEINQSAAQPRRNKLGAIGRPKTAPNQSINGVSGSITKKEQKRQPLKTSPAPLVMVGNKSGQPEGTKLIPNLKMGRTTTAFPHSTPNHIKEPDPKNGESTSFGESQEKGATLVPRPTLHRQSFSLDEGMLLSFSNKEFGWFGSNSLDKLEDSKRENSFQSSKKREECLKIYDKMVKTGMTVKLDTILRGMMTPSEYRVFIKAAETAAKQLAATEEEKQEVEKVDNEALGADAGVTSVPFPFLDNEITTE